MPPLPGLSVGHASDQAMKSGVTVFIPERPATAAVHVAGGAPASRETELLRPENTVATVNGVVLTGGSAFGLAAADGAMEWLAAKGRGHPVGPVRVPIVPAVALFDLLNGGTKPTDLASAYRRLGKAACEAATDDAPQFGTVGAGTGATTADLKGGFGMARTVTGDGSTLAAFVAVNSVGRVTLGSTPHFRAAPFEREAEFGGLGLPPTLPPDAAALITKRPIEPGANTTIAVIATDCPLSPAATKRLAIAAHDGIALAVYPAHTPFDGDTVFALSTGIGAPSGDPLQLAALCAAAAAALARAIACAVFAATPAPHDRFPTWRERYG